MTILEARIHDTNFVGSLSSSLYHPPSRVRWLREGQDTSVTFHTDYHLQNARRSAGTFRVAWLLEPRAITPEAYTSILSNLDAFDLVLTHHADMLGHGDKFVFYPNGMSWIAAADWKQHPKSKNISIVASSKRSTDGHLLRHRIIEATRGKMDVFGRGYKPVEHKVEALGPYRFSVTIENSSTPWYFTEKLLDCFATFTVPIYWGCPGIAKFFDTDGMIIASSEEEIVEAIEHVEHDGESIYASMIDAMARNHASAWQYRVAEDWIVDNVLVPRGIIKA